MLRGTSWPRVVHFRPRRPSRRGPSRVLRFTTIGACGLLFLTGACAGASGEPPASPVAVEPVPVEAPPSAAAGQLPPLDATEQRLARDLRQYVEILSGLGQRNTDDPLSHADAIDWVSGILEGFGYTVDRQGFTFGDEVVQNLVVHVPGLRRGDEVVVIGARLDTRPGSGGADDNASGVAALLCLARELIGKRALRSIELVWFSDGSARRDTNGSGSRAFLEHFAKETSQIAAMVELHGLGFYSDAPGSQRTPNEFASGDPNGDFVAVFGYVQHAALWDGFTVAFTAAASLPVRRFTMLDESPLPSAHVDFARAGLPTLLITDTQSWRNPDFGVAADTPERLDYERMARVVAALQRALHTVYGPFDEPPEAPNP